MRENHQDFWDISKLPQPKAAIEAGDLHAALNGFAFRELLDYREKGRHSSDIWICGFGVALWLMGDTDGAARIWSNACDEALRGKFKYSSTGTFQPGLLLWFASVWLKDQDWHEDAEALFEKLLNKRRPFMGAGFSSRLARLLRKEIDLPQIQAAYTNEPHHIKQSYDWETLFYAGVRAIEEGNISETRRLWDQAEERTDTCGCLEYYLLEHERRKLNA
jgi:hypothetical protein